MNFKITSNPFTNIKFSFSKDYGITENISAVDPQTESLRTSYDLTLTPFSNLNFGWRRSEDFSSSSGLLNVTTSKNFGLTLKPFEKVNIKYDYTLTEDEKETDVTSTNNTGQNLTVTIPIKFNIDLRYVYSMRRNADTLGYGTSSEDNGFNIGYKSPMINGSNFMLNFSLDTDARQSSTADLDTKQQNTVNFGLDGRASMIRILDVTFSHRDAVTKSNSYIDDQETISDSIGGSLKYTILQLINGNIDMRFNSRESNTHSTSTLNSDRTLTNKIDYKTGDLSLGLSVTFSENETDDNVTSKKGIAPTLSYSLTKGRITCRYSLNDRVDEDPITGDLTSSRDTNYDFGFNYSVAQNATFDLKYSARNHIDFKDAGNNEDSDRISTGLNFKF
ncbi:hypothetical protein HZA55_06095 [Candidatus Poribacteria bacterium]|nr:hypothetical protein [Candidatus Poribacteria bacterium]